MFSAVLWDFGGVFTTSPFENFAAFEASRGLPKDFIRGVNSTNPDTNAWAQLEAGGVDTSRLWADIRDNVVSRTLACMLPALALAYEHSYPPPRTRGGAAPPPPEQRCFQVPIRLAISRAIFARSSTKLQFTDALFCWRRV